MREELTEVQEEIYRYIVHSIRKNGYSPTIREIQNHFGYSSSNSVVTQLNKIVDKGYITKSSSKGSMKARTIRLVDDIIGNLTIDTPHLNRALKDLEQRGYSIEANVAVEFLKSLDINVI